jgi:hypothetical protein
VGRAACIPERTIAADDLHALEARREQVAPGSLDNVVIDVDGDNVAPLAHQVRQ